MARTSGQRDIGALRVAIVCVGFSGVLLGLFAALLGYAEGQMPSLTLIGVSMFLGFVVASMGFTRWPASTLSRPQRIAGYWLLAAVIVLELMIPLNFIAGRRHTSFEWTENVVQELSGYSRSIVARVDKPLRITTLFLQESQSEEDPRFGLFVFNITRKLLDLYVEANRLVAVEHIDLARDQEKLIALQKRFDRPLLPGVILEYEGRTREIDYTRLLRDFIPGEMPFASEREEQQAEQTAYRGEEAVTGAILELSDRKRPLLCFVTGHDEMSILTHPKMRQVADDLRRRNYDLREVADLAGGVPDNCSVLMVVDPKVAFSPNEVEVVRNHLGRGGKLFYAAGPGVNTGVEQALADFGFAFDPGVVIDPALANRELTDWGRVAVYPLAQHEIVNEIGRLRMEFIAVRGVGALPPPPGASASNYRVAVDLLVTGRNCWSERDLDRVGYDPKTDRPGPLPAAAAHEQPERDAQGNPWPENLPRTRIVAVGSGDFMVGFRNRPITTPPGNSEFFFRAVDWLAQKRYLMHIKPRPLDYRALDLMTISDLKWIFWLTTVIIPCAFLVLGGAIWFVRRR